MHDENESCIFIVVVGWQWCCLHFFHRWPLLAPIILHFYIYLCTDLFGRGVLCMRWDIWVRFVFLHFIRTIPCLYALSLYFPIYILRFWFYYVLIDQYLQSHGYLFGPGAFNRIYCGKWVKVPEPKHHTFISFWNIFKTICVHDRLVVVWSIGEYGTRNQVVGIRKFIWISINVRINKCKFI